LSGGPAAPVSRVKAYTRHLSDWPDGPTCRHHIIVGLRGEVGQMGRIGGFGAQPWDFSFSFILFPFPFSFMFYFFLIALIVLNPNLNLNVRFSFESIIHIHTLMLE
jgi:hypothetical protein